MWFLRVVFDLMQLDFRPIGSPAWHQVLTSTIEIKGGVMKALWVYGLFLFFTIIAYDRLSTPLSDAGSLGKSQLASAIAASMPALRTPDYALDRDAPSGSTPEPAQLAAAPIPEAKYDGDMRGNFSTYLLLHETRDASIPFEIAPRANECRETFLKARS